VSILLKDRAIPEISGKQMKKNENVTLSSKTKRGRKKERNTVD